MSVEVALGFNMLKPYSIAAFQMDNRKESLGVLGAIKGWFDEPEVVFVLVRVRCDLLLSGHALGVHVRMRVEHASCVLRAFDSDDRTICNILGSVCIEMVSLKQRCKAVSVNYDISNSNISTKLTIRVVWKAELMNPSPDPEWLHILGNKRCE